MSKKKDSKQEELAIRILKVAKCQSNSGKATLTYQIGCDEQSAIHLRVMANSGSGYFNRDWKAYTAIRAALDKEGKAEPVTSHALTDLYKFQSTNSPAFLFAALKAEGLVAVSKVKPRAYDQVSDAAFLAGVRKLIDGKAVPASSNDKAGRNSKGKVAEATPTTITEAATPEPSVPEPTTKPPRRGRPKKEAPMVDAVVLEVAPAEGA
jgi:hypothetical protein